MKLGELYEEKSKLILYKGLSLFNGYDDYEHEVGKFGMAIPGFLSTYHIGRVYSEPELTGSADNPSIIVEVMLFRSEIENKTSQFIKWCDERGQRYDISSGYPKEWRNEIWTVNCESSGHTGVSCFDYSDFVYCGIMKQYKVIKHYNNQEEWKMDI